MPLIFIKFLLFLLFTSSQNVSYAGDLPIQKSTILPFLKEKTKISFKLTKDLENIFEELSKNLPEGIKILPSKKKDNLYHFAFHEIPLCKYEIRIGSFGHQASVFGSLPKLEDLPNLILSPQKVKPNFKDIIDPKSLEYETTCLLPTQNKLLQVYVWTYKKENHLFKGYFYESSLVFEETLTFDLHTEKVKVQAYQRNPRHSDLVEFSVNTNGSGTLDNKFFTTHVARGGLTRAESSEDFIFSPNHSHFPEASVFAHANVILSYFQSLGYKFTDFYPITLYLHSTISKSVNNALYTPSLSNKGTGASIQLGDGDGILLENLAIDADVISHEFGHHVLFDTLRGTNGESLVLHEGLADYFVFSLFNSPCLGESICPASSPLCFLQNQCLRTADNSLEYKSEEYEALEAHLQGQLISGFLWDLREVLGAKITDQLVFKSSKLFTSTTDIYDLLVAILYVDVEEFKGKYSCTIFDLAKQRSLDSLLEDLDCKNSELIVEEQNKIQPPTNATDNSKTPEDTSETPKRKQDKGFFGCSVSTAHSPANPPHIPLLIFVPLLWTILRIFKKLFTRTLK
jgi:hypothetical protein